MSRLVPFVLIAASCGRIDYDPTSRSCDLPIDGLLLCEDFEGDLAQWTDQGAEATTTDRIAHSGRKSFASRIDERVAYLGRKLPRALASGTTLHGRAYVYLPEDVGAQSSIVVMELAATPKISIDIFPGTLLQWVTETDGNFPISSEPIPTDQWFCLQTEILFDDVAGHAIAKVNGVTFVENLAADTTSSAAFEDIYFGQVVTAQVEGSNEFFIDDIAVGTQPIPCL